ncbi:MAG: endonuclease III domain-containing protein [Deltaproteobacteria bacterium]|nr:endonuclease III domain-containing protein [Deltaproteobacteria bacterium]
MTPQAKIHNIYQTLLKAYGPQGWWPITVQGSRQSKTTNIKGYHPGVYHFPRDDIQKLEIAVGAILTQNTNWNNVVTALDSLASAGLFSMQGLLHGKIGQIALAIKSVGYYNQKAQYLNNLVRFLHRFPFQKLERQATGVIREELLEIKGIGPETADCILLYALKKPSFVVDTYTRRIFSGLGMVSETVSYNSLKMLFESSLKKDLVVFQEYHALLVYHGKRYYSKKPYGNGDVILRSQ